MNIYSIFVLGNNANQLRRADQCSHRTSHKSERAIGSGVIVKHDYLFYGLFTRFDDCNSTTAGLIDTQAFTLYNNADAIGNAYNCVINVLFEMIKV